MVHESFPSTTEKQLADLKDLFESRAEPTAETRHIVLPNNSRAEQNCPSCQKHFKTNSKYKLNQYLMHAKHCRGTGVPCGASEKTRVGHTRAHRLKTLLRRDRAGEFAFSQHFPKKLLKKFEQVMDLFYTVMERYDKNVTFRQEHTIDMEFKD